MRLRALFIVLLSLFVYSLVYSQDPGNFPTSLHATREGKRTWYKKENGGFENITNIPVENVNCLKCHPGTKADGTVIDPATYNPDCYDCHNFSTGTQVPDDICLKCHSRQKNEKTLYPGVDVHFAKGFTCMTCHTKKEMHGDGTRYNSWLDPGATEVKCEKCHSPLASNTAHNIHSAKVHCTACHAKTVITCYNCHFESELQAKIKRPYGVLRDFVLLVRRMPDDKVYSGTIMTLKYQNQTFVTIAPYRSHIIMPKDSTRKCSECHNNANVQTYNQTGQIYVVKWDTTQKKLINAKGVIPVPPNWKTALKFDFVDYTGRVDSATDPTKWVFLKSGADLMQELSTYVAPLTSEQMAKLSMQVSVKDGNSLIPTEFNLMQNYPNPFNPTTTIEFHLPKATNVTIKVYNSIGVEVKTLVNDKRYEAGIHRITFDAENLPSGVYIYKMITPEFSASKKMVLLK